MKTLIPNDPPFIWKTTYDDGRFKVTYGVNGPRAGVYWAHDRQTGMDVKMISLHGALIAIRVKSLFFEVIGIPDMKRTRKEDK
jgi:hypothetical protein